MYICSYKKLAEKTKKNDTMIEGQNTIGINDKNLRYQIRICALW